MLSSKDRAVVEQFQHLMQERGVPVLETIVFGSRARGDADEDSDLDVLVLVKRRDRQVREQVRHCAWEVGFDEGLFIQTVVLTPEEAEHSPERSSLLMQAVRLEGVRV
ncbi:MAG TPA: nucleotidyltransferase domain-containing protein [Firmicutes bacterium]|nr:nucleotidyltransferase domain-containing protein [Bacillota bacterium]